MTAAPVVVIRDPGERSRIARAILADLGPWFGRPDSTERYIREAAGLAFLAVLDGADPVGFLTVRSATRATAEIHVMGVRADHHRKGVGRALIGAAAGAARASGHALLSVKTVGPSFPNEAYAVTRAFYAALGFLPVEEIPDLWGPGMPCLILVKPLGA